MAGSSHGTPFKMKGSPYKKANSPAKDRKSSSGPDWKANNAHNQRHVEGLPEDHGKKKK